MFCKQFQFKQIPGDADRYVHFRGLSTLPCSFFSQA